MRTSPITRSSALGLAAALILLLLAVSCGQKQSDSKITKAPEATLVYYALPR